MKNRALLIMAGVLFVLGAQAQTNSVTYNIAHGLNALVNQVIAGSNSVGEVIGYNVPDGTTVFLYQAGAGYYDNAEFISGFGWLDADDGGATTNGPQLMPGNGFFLYDPGSNFQFTAVGLATSPNLPLDLGCRVQYFLGRQTVGLGTFDNVVDEGVQDGDQIAVYDGINETNPPATLSTNDFAIYTYSGGGWVPNMPYLIPGQAAFFELSCGSNSCLTVQVSNVVVASGSALTQVSFAPQALDTCGATATVYCRPPSGSFFSKGTTPVHCVAADTFGNIASGDFTVTVSPLPMVAPQAPTNSYQISLAPGYNLIAYQFINGGNTLREIMTNVPDGTVATKYLNDTSNWLQSTFSASLGAWVPGNITLKPGEGMFLYNPNPTNMLLSLAGHENPLNRVSLTNQIALLSCQSNTVGTYSNIVSTPNPPANGTRIFQLAGGGDYNVFQYTSGHWTPSEPSNAVGQAFWISVPGGPMPPTIPIAPAITQEPSNILAGSGNRVAFGAVATGDAPLQYQWRVNGNPLPGQTNDTLNIPSVSSTNLGRYDLLVQNQIGIAQSTSVFITLSDLQPLPFNDSFEHAGTISGESGTGIGANTNATFEAGEPSADGVPGGASVWVQWVCPTDGVATFTTAGSDFDTLLGIYSGTNLTGLTTIGGDDDGAGFLCSSVSFNATGGTIYDVQVDGFYGITGDIVLNWNLAPTEEKLPVILIQPVRQTSSAGSNVMFSVTAQSPVGVTYQWLINGTPISNATNSFYFTNVSVATVGFYQCLVSNANGDGLSVLSRPADLQINVPAFGQPVNTGARAESKVQNVMDTTVRPNDPYDPPIVTGYSGVETFSMYDATQADPEPLHCGYICAYTKWHPYTAMGNGLLSVSDFGTSFSGVVGVYSGPDFTLVPLACSGGHPAGTEVVAFEAQMGTQYWIAVSATEAVNNQTVQLQYSMLAPPFYTLLPVSQSVIPNTNDLTLSVATTGDPAVGYQWQLNGTNLMGVTGSSYTIPTFTAANAGNYTIIATNSVGTNIFVYASEYLNGPLQFVNTTNLNQSNILFSQLITLPNSNYIFATSPDTINWTTNYTGFSSATGIINFTNNITQNPPQQYYKAILPVIN